MRNLGKKFAKITNSLTNFFLLVFRIIWYFFEVKLHMIDFYFFFNAI